MCVKEPTKKTWRTRVFPSAVVGTAVAAVGTMVFAPATTEPTAAARQHTMLSAAHPAAQAAPPVTEDESVADKVQQAERAVAPDAQVGVEVFDRHTQTVLTSADSRQQFASMSTVKVVIALDILSSNNWQLPNPATQQQLARMLADSDDTIANAFWAEDGGPAEVTRISDQLKLTGTQPPADPNEWGDTRTTPQDMVTVYRFITDQLSIPARDLILTALAKAPRYAADGVDQYFGIPNALPQTAWAIKQGWGTSDNQAVFHTTGLVGSDCRYIVVVLTSAPAGEYATVPEATTAGTSALATAMGAAH